MCDWVQHLILSRIQIQTQIKHVKVHSTQSLHLCFNITWLVQKTQSSIIYLHLDLSASLKWGLFRLPLSEHGVSRGLCPCQRHREVHPNCCVGSWSSHLLTGWGRLPPTPPSEHWSARWTAPRRRQRSCLRCPRCWCPHRTTYRPTARGQTKHTKSNEVDFIPCSTSKSEGHKSALMPRALFKVRWCV